MSDTTAARLDRAVDDVLLRGRPIPSGDRELDDLIQTALLLRAGLGPVPPSHRFEERLARRLRRGGLVERLAGGTAHAGLMARRELRHRGRLLMTGALGSAAVGVAGVTVYAVWRFSHR